MSNTLVAGPGDSTRGILYGLTAALIWGAFPVVTRLGVGQDLGAMDVTAIRFAVAGLILLPVFIRFMKNARPPARASLILTCGAGVPYMLIVTAGLTLAPAAHFGVIAPSSMLIFASAGGRIFLGARLNRAGILGIALIVLGIIIIGGEGLLEKSRADMEHAWLGDLMFVGGGFCWAGYTIASRYWSVEPLGGISIVAVISMLVFLPAYALIIYFFGGGPARASTSTLLTQAIYQGILSGVVALLLYTRAVEKLGAARGAVFAALVPGFALLIAVPVLGEIPTVTQVLGVLIVTAGMIIALGLHPRRASQFKNGT